MSILRSIGWALVTSLCVFRLAYDAHTRSKWTEAQMSKLSSVHIGVARRAVSNLFFVEENRRTADAALAMCCALPFELHLRRVRLDYLCRLTVFGPDFLLVALDVLAPHPFS